jgi:flavin-dependent dehydrogenase
MEWAMPIDNACKQRAQPVTSETESMKTPVVIVGGGPAGAACAMFLVRQGIKPLIVEQENFPRYHVGESLTGAGGQVLRDLGLESEMVRRKHPTKLGVKVYGKSERGSWFVPVMGRDQNWKLFYWNTWQVRRSEFDQMMLDEALNRGATLLPGKAVKPLVSDDGSVRGVQVRLADSDTLEEIQSELLLDCTGMATWLANYGGVTGPKYLGAYDKQIAIFSQVADTVRDNGTARDECKDNTLILYKAKYHWAWFIPIDDEVVSVGVVAPAAYFLDSKESKRDFLIRELHELHPELKKRIPEVKLVEDVHVIPNYSYQVKNFSGKGFFCVGDAHRFVDPIFSFGLTVGLREAQFLAPVVKAYLGGANRHLPNPFANTQLDFEKAIDIFEDVLDSFWEHPMAFSVYVHDRYRDDITDTFAGRVYEHQPSPAVGTFRKLLAREDQRQQSYLNEDIYSIPIGSRFHPERAPIWEVGSQVESTEAWMGPR